MACPSPVLSDSDSHRRVMVSDHHYYLLRIGQIDPPIAFVTGTKPEAAPDEHYGCDHPGKRHYRWP